MNANLRTDIQPQFVFEQMQRGSVQSGGCQGAHLTTRFKLSVPQVCQPQNSEQKPARQQTPRFSEKQ
jgi:hypothetical protein